MYKVQQTKFLQHHLDCCEHQMINMAKQTCQGVRLERNAPTIMPISRMVPGSSIAMYGDQKKNYLLGTKSMYIFIILRQLTLLLIAGRSRTACPHSCPKDNPVALVIGDFGSHLSSTNVPRFWRDI